MFKYYMVGYLIDFAYNIVVSRQLMDDMKVKYPTYSEEHLTVLMIIAGASVALIYPLVWITAIISKVMSIGNKDK